MHLDKFKDIKSQRLWRWFEKLQKYDFTISYAPSKKNPSDALSRLPRVDDELVNTLPENCEAAFTVNSTEISEQLQPAINITNSKLKEAQEADATIITAKEWVLNGTRPDTSTNLTSELLTYYNSFDRLKVESDILYRSYLYILFG